MGWWSYTVTGGDSPCDVQSVIEHEILDIVHDNLTDDDIKNIIIKKLDVLDDIKTYTKLNEYAEYSIVCQVLGYYLLWYGLDPANEHVKSILQKAKQGAIEDEWAMENVERKQRMDEFINLIDAYDGTPTMVPTESLFDMIFNKEE